MKILLIALLIAFSTLACAEWLPTTTKHDVFIDSTRVVWGENYVTVWIRYDYPNSKGYAVIQERHYCTKEPLVARLYATEYSSAGQLMRQTEGSKITERLMPNSVGMHIHDQLCEELPKLLRTK